MSPKMERLQKVIAMSGVTSRRKAEELILEGRVKVNNKIVTTLGTKVSSKDEVKVDDIPLEKEPLVYYVLYKPRGYITSVEDDKGRKTVIDLMHGVSERIFPIGRLDYNTSGVLLLTNDGDFAHLLMHPKHEIEKVYVAKLKGIPSKVALNRLLKGVYDQGELLKTIHYKVISIDKRKKTMVVEITLHEGRNRHIHRMFNQIGYPVLKLNRKRYGLIDVEGLQPGKYRSLSRQEIHQLKLLASKNVKQ